MVLILVHSNIHLDIGISSMKAPSDLANNLVIKKVLGCTNKAVVGQKSALCSCRLSADSHEIGSVNEMRNYSQKKPDDKNEIAVPSLIYSAQIRNLGRGRIEKHPDPFMTDRSFHPFLRHWRS